jgi:Rrf2 family protein
MFISQKCYYGIRALFELAGERGSSQRSVADIATAQAIPRRFLETILAELRRAGLVDARRGANGGYSLAHAPDRVTVGDIVRVLQGPLDAVSCDPGPAGHACPLAGSCAFLPLWARVEAAISEVLDETTFADLAEEQARRKNRYVADYMI